MTETQRQPLPEAIGRVEYNAPDRVREALDGAYGEDQQRIAWVGMAVIDTLLKKNSDYGSSVFQPPVLTPHVSVDDAILVRMSDKFGRLRRLQELRANGDSPLVDESLQDTIKDVAGYSILWLAKPEVEVTP